MLARSGQALTTSVRKLDKPPSLLQRLFWKRSKFWCDGSVPVGMISTEESRTLTSLMTIENASTEEPVGWLSFIDDIHDIQRWLAYPPHIEGREVVSFVRLTRSWDFMPVEIVRPFASTTLGCLIAIVHRMGLTWIEFKPDEGIIRAIGRGRSISAFRLRGLGLAIEYVGNGRPLQELQIGEHDLIQSEGPRVQGSVSVPSYYYEDNSRVYIL
jgi:hypothetical protein